MVKFKQASYFLMALDSKCKLLESLLTKNGLVIMNCDTVNFWSLFYFVWFFVLVSSHFNPCLKLGNRSPERIA